MIRCAISVVFNCSKSSMPYVISRNTTDLANLLPPPYIFVPSQLSPLEERLCVEQNRQLDWMVAGSPKSKGGRRYTGSPRQLYWVGTL